MNLRLYIICTAAILSLMSPAVAGSTATIHGAVYKWDTFEPLDNAVIEVNSIPTQEMVAKNGLYSVELVPGNYTIKATYSQKGVLTYYLEKTIEIEDGEDYVLDLLLPPVNSEGLMDGSKVNIFSENLNESAKSSSQSAKNLRKEAAIDKINNFNGVDITELRTPLTKQSGLYFSGVYYLLIALTFSILPVGGYRLFRKHKRIEKNAPQEDKTGHIIRDFFEFVNTPRISVKVLDKSIGLERKEPAESKEECPAPKTELVELEAEEENKKTFLEESAHNSKIETLALKKKLILSKDLQEVLKIIRSQGGRITQKDLRSMLNYSEVKVCLMLADLEKRQRIQKFKNGRENIVILIDEER